VGYINRRNAVVSWATWVVTKRVLKSKAKDAVPSIDTETKKPNKSAIALLVAGTVGALTFWKKRSGGESPSDTAT
jgi:hypothetical protein